MWFFVKGLAATATQIIADNNLQGEQRPEDLRARVNQFVQECQEKGASQLMSEMASRYNAQQEAAKRANGMVIKANDRAN